MIPSKGCVLPCDLVLLNGSCIVDESMLTGESIPVTKTSLAKSEDTIYNEKEHARHTLFCGTKVLQTRNFEDNEVSVILIKVLMFSDSYFLARYYAIDIDSGNKNWF